MLDKLFAIILQAIMSMVEDVTKQHLIPKQKEAFLCCAKCCDNNADSTQNLQNWEADR